MLWCDDHITSLMLWCPLRYAFWTVLYTFYAKLLIWSLNLSLPFLEWQYNCALKAGSYQFLQSVSLCYVKVKGKGHLIGSQPLGNWEEPWAPSIYHGVSRCGRLPTFPFSELTPVILKLSKLDLQWLSIGWSVWCCISVCMMDAVKPCKVKYCLNLWDNISSNGLNKNETLNSPVAFR